MIRSIRESRVWSTFSPPEVPSYSPRAVTPSHSSWNRNHRHWCFSLATSVEFMISISIGFAKKREEGMIDRR